MLERPLRRDAPAAEIASPRASGAASRVGPRALAAAAAGVGLAAIAWRELLWHAPKHRLGEELEQFFFVPSQTVAPLVVMLCAWLVVRRLGRLRRIEAFAPAPILAGGLLAAGAALQLWATLTGAADLLAPALALFGLGAAAWWKGRPALRLLRLPAVFLLFAMPLPAPLQNEIVYRLQVATADLTGVLLTLLRVPHTVSGDQILRTHQTFSVIEACSGLRSIETLTLVAVLMGDLFRRSTRHALLLALAAPPVALFLNGWRAVALILNPHSEIVAVHNVQGIAILLGGLVLLFGLDGLLERLLPRRRAAPPAADAPEGPARRPAARGPALPLALLALLAIGALAFPRLPVVPPDSMYLSQQLASGIGDLFSRELEPDPHFLGSTGFRESVTRRFTRDSHPIDVFLGVSWRAGRARSAIAPKTAVPGSGWILEREEPHPAFPDGTQVWSGIYRSGTQRLLVYHWYEGSEGLLMESLRALTAIDASPFGAAAELRVVRLSTDLEAPVATGLPPARERLDAFYRELRPVLDRLAIPPPAQVGAGGKSLPDFHGWEKLFRPQGNLHWDELESNQTLAGEVGMGMPLATQEAGARASAEILEGRRIRGANGKAGETT